MFNGGEVIFDIVKGLVRSKKSYFRASFAVRIPNHFHFFIDFTIFEDQDVFFFIAPNTQLEPGRQCIHYRNADAVQTARDLIGILVKFTASVKLGHNHLGRRYPLFLVDINRNTAAIIGHTHRAITVQNNFDNIAIPGQSFIDGVINNLIDHMVETGTVIGITNIHTRAFAYRIEAFQNLNRLGIISLIPFHDFGFWVYVFSVIIFAHTL